MTKLRIVLALLVALVLPVAAEAVSDGCLPTLAHNTGATGRRGKRELGLRISRGPAALRDMASAMPGRLRRCAAAASVAAIAQPGILLRRQFGSPPRGPSVRYCPGEGPAERVRLLQWSLHTEDVCFSRSSHPTVSCSMRPGHSRWSASTVHKVFRSRCPPPALRLPPSLTVQAPAALHVTPATRSASRYEIINPGPPILVELKTGARLPDGSVVPIQDEEGVLPTGVTVIPVFTGFVLPAGVPPGIYAIEAEILDATLGETISEDSAALTVAP